MKTINTMDATGAALDWLVAMCEMGREDYRDRGLLVHRVGYGQPMPPFSTDWSQGGPIIERERIQIAPLPDNGWRGHWRALKGGQDVWMDCFGSEATPLIAAMRCFVASKLGETVEVPDELI